MLPQTLPDDMTQAFDDLSDEVVHVAKDLKAKSARPLEMASQLRAVAERLERLNVCLVMRTVFDQGEMN